MNNKNDSLNKVTRQVDEVKLLIVDNIDKMLERSENVAVVADKSEALRNYSQSFSVQSKVIRENANKKMWMIVCYGFIALFVLVLILLIIKA